MCATLFKPHRTQPGQLLDLLPLSTRWWIPDSQTVHLTQNYKTTTRMRVQMKDCPACVTTARDHRPRYSWENTNVYQNMNYPRQVIQYKVREQGKLKSLMILKQRSTVFKKCISTNTTSMSKGSTLSIPSTQANCMDSNTRGVVHSRRHTPQRPQNLIKDSSTGSASLTPTALPKPAELQSLVSVAAWQRLCISEFRLETTAETQGTGKGKWHLCTTPPGNVLGFSFALVGCSKGLFLEGLQRLGASSVANSIYCSVVWKVRHEILATPLNKAFQSNRHNSSQGLRNRWFH